MKRAWVATLIGCWVIRAVPKARYGRFGLGYLAGIGVVYGTYSPLGRIVGGI
jgi:hypothetical protein